MGCISLKKTVDMETLTTEQSELLNDLIAINNDRIEGYAKAIGLVDAEQDVDLISLFERLGQQSQQFKAQLTPLVASDGGKPAASDRAMGKLYRMWMDSRISIAGDDRKSILASCEKGEDVFKKVYFDVWKEAQHLEETIKAMIKSQGEVQAQAHDEVRALRDEQ